MHEFQIQSTLVEGVWVVALRGEARVEFSDGLVREVARILSEEPADVLLNCKQLQFLDSASTGALLQVASQVRGCDRAVALYGLSNVVRRVLDVTKLSESLSIAADETEARALLTER